MGVWIETSLRTRSPPRGGDKSSGKIKHQVATECENGKKNNFRVLSWRFLRSFISSITTDLSLRSFCLNWLQNLSTKFSTKICLQKYFNKNYKCFAMSSLIAAIDFRLSSSCFLMNADSENDLVFVPALKLRHKLL